MGSAGRPAARGSLKRASQYSSGSGASGAGSARGTGRVASDASFSICFGVGIRQDAGLSLISQLEHIKNESRVQLFAEAGPWKTRSSFPSDSCSNPRLPYALSCGTGAPQPIALKGGVTRIFGRENHDLKTPETEEAERRRPPPKSPDRGIEGNHDGACDAGGVGTVRRREHH